MSSISAPVGKNGANKTEDVTVVQTLLNDNLRKIDPLPPLVVNGKIGTDTLSYIETFQKRVVNQSAPNVLVEPTGTTFQSLLQCGCDTPTANYPYDADTFATIGRIKTTILEFSKRFSVPAIAVAGSIADEYNTRRGVRIPVDWFQDEVLINLMPNFAIVIDAKLGFHSKLLNSTMHDLGIGNIKLDTAKQLYAEFKDTFDKQDMDYSDLVDYLRSERGTVHVACLVIKKAMAVLGPYVNGMSEEKKEGVYVTYYKQGPTYLSRFKSKLAANGAARIEVGEGCRVILQRAKFVSTLK